MSVSIATGVSSLDVLSSTGAAAVVGAASETVRSISPSRHTLASADGSFGTLGTRIMSWAGSGTASDGTRAIKSSYSRTSGTAVLSSSPDKSAPNVIRIGGNGAGTAVTWTEALTTGFVDNTARNIGIWVRALPRSDSGRYTMARVTLNRDAAGAIDFSNPFGDWIFRVRADGLWRLYSLTCTATAGYFKSSSSPAVFIPGTGATLAWARVYAPSTVECYELPVLPNGDVIEYGPIYLNPRGGKAAAIVRFDDNKSSIYTPLSTSGTGSFSSLFPSGFAGRSGVSISAAAGDAMSMIDLVEAFGFKSTHYILCRHVGQQPGFATLDQLRSLVTRGHQVAFQSYYNPVGTAVHGARLLGPFGYSSICSAGSITGISTTTLTQSGHVIPNTTVRNAATGAQGFPVVWDSAGLPSTITAGTTYWLRYLSSTTFSVHPSELDARDNTGAINFTGATASSLVYRYVGATNDYTGILADYNAGKSWFSENGFGDGYRYYALNQSAHDRYVFTALDVFGEMYPAFGGNAPDDLMSLTNAAYVGTNYTLDARVSAEHLLCEANIGTDNLVSEAAVREFVRLQVQEGAIIQNIGHDHRADTMAWYLDELKYWSDAGMVYVGTHKEVVQEVQKARVSG